jgi:hypothetical protein
MLIRREPHSRKLTLSARLFAAAAVTPLAEKYATNFLLIVKFLLFYQLSFCLPADRAWDFFAAGRSAPLRPPNAGNRQGSAP